MGGRIRSFSVSGHTELSPKKRYPDPLRRHIFLGRFSAVISISVSQARLDLASRAVQVDRPAMNFRLLFALPALVAPLSAATETAPAGCDCEKDAATVGPVPSTTATASTAPEAPTAPRGHPLKGVIVAVVAEKSALLVKHEEIPDVMDAMTMLLKVDAATLAAAKKDQAITARLVKKADGWWLQDVKIAETVK